MISVVAVLSLLVHGPAGPPGDAPPPDAPAPAPLEAAPPSEPPDPPPDLRGGGPPAGEAAHPDATPPVPPGADTPVGDPFREGAPAAPGVGDPFRGESPSPQARPPREPTPPRGRSGAAGGHGYRPLPAPPPPEDPRRIRKQPWRGLGWFAIELGMTVPVGGHDLAHGNVISGAGGFQLGFRPIEWLGLYTGLTTFVHDAEELLVFDDAGGVSEVQAFGRIVAFDLAVLRLYVPNVRRFQPRLDLGAGVGTYDPPFGTDTVAVGHGKFGVGADIWVSPTFTIGLGSAYRLLAIRDDVGHTLQFGLDFAVHW